MSPAALLREHASDLRQAIRKGRIPADLRAPLLAYLDLRLEGAEGQAESATQRSAERSARIRAGIRQAAAGLAERRPKIALLTRMVTRRIEIAPKKYGLERAVGVRTVRDELRKLYVLGTSGIGGDVCMADSGRVSHQPENIA